MITPSDILHGKILIVDNQKGNILLLERILRAAGYAGITSTTDSTAACALHREHRYDLIILDLEMPVMDGFQVMTGLKELETESYMPVLAVTAHPAHKLRALEAGAKDFVSMPFDLAEVLLRVRNMLEIRLLHKQAEEHNKFKTRLVAVVSHEVGNALSVMKTATFLLKKNLPPESVKANAKFFEMLVLNIDGLTGAVHNLLNMARLEAAKLAVDFAATDAGEILRSAVKRMEVIWEKKALKVSLKLPAALPPVRADLPSLTLVVSNLLSNAIKYTPENGSIVLGMLAETSRPGYYRLYVEDSGIGISAEEQGKIMSGHYRSESGKKMAADGFGVGLSLAQQIVTAHDSSIEIESAPGKGSRFSFLLRELPQGAAAADFKGGS